MISETMISILTKMIRKIYPKRSIEEEEKWMAKSLITRREKLQLNNLN
jgi:predicted site-specific integrase-resolvase